MMKGLLALVALASGSMVFSSPAAARTPPENYAACLVQTRPNVVQELLRARTAEAANLPYGELANNDRCFNQVFGKGQFTPEDAGVSMDMLRGRLAEQTLLAESSGVAALQPLPLKQQRYIRPWFAATSRPSAVDEMAACMADTNPAGIHALIQTVPGSADEDSAVAALQPSLTKCLSAGTRLLANRAGVAALQPSLTKCLSAGTRLLANRAGLRAALADALYQRLNDPALSLAHISRERGR